MIPAVRCRRRRCCAADRVAIPAAGGIWHARPKRVLVSELCSRTATAAGCRNAAIAPSRRRLPDRRRDGAATGGAVLADRGRRAPRAGAR
eukprot:352225-Chlamydomonas_euryale.AAC.11